MMVSACVINDWTFSLSPEGHLSLSVNGSVDNGGTMYQLFTAA